MQVHSYGKSVKALLTAGVQSTKSDIPLGQKFEDGERVYRWAYVKCASAVPGLCFICSSYRSTISTQALSGPGDHFNSAVAGWGGSIGDVNIKLYGVSGMTDEDMYEDGTFEVLSGTGKGFSYKVNSYERGGSGVHTLRLNDPLQVALDTTTYAYLRPNKYYGLAFQAGVLSASQVYLRGGVATVSVTASGYCLVQTRGPGIGMAIAATSAGRLVAPMNVSGQISAIIMSGIVNAVMPWGYSAGEAIGADDFFAVDWCIE